MARDEEKFLFSWFNCGYMCGIIYKEHGTMVTGTVCHHFQLTIFFDTIAHILWMFQEVFVSLLTVIHPAALEYYFSLVNLYKTGYNENRLNESKG